MSAHAASSLLDAGALASLRRSVVTIVAGPFSGTGWVALTNDIVVTSWRAVAFQSDVSLGFEDGRRIAGRVAHVDAERDLAFVLPVEAIAIQPLPMRVDPQPRLGEPVVVLIASPSDALIAAQAVVSAESRGGELAALDPDPTPRAGRGGSPVIDASGRVIGVITAGRRQTRNTLDRGRHVLPIGLLSRDLRSLDLPASELGERALIHRCPGCTEPFTAENDRCQSCGLLLPHAFETPACAIGAERVIRDALSTLGIVSNRVRIAPLAWRIFHRALGGEATPSEVTIRVDDLGLQVILRVPLVRVPATNHEHFFRLLLTINDQTGGVCRVSISNDIVALSFAEPVSAFASEHDVSVVFHDLVRLADQYRKVFAELFGAEPLRELVG